MRQVFIVTSGGQITRADCAQLKRFVADQMAAEASAVEYEIHQVEWLNDIDVPDGCDLIVNPQGHIAHYDEQ